MSGNNLKDLQDKIDAMKKGDKDDSGSEEREAEMRQTGMKAGSEFMAYIFSGGFVGWLIGHFFGNMPLWLIVFLFAGFGLGIYRAYVSMNSDS